MKLSSRVRKLDTTLAPRHSEAAKLTAEDRTRLDHLFNLIEQEKGPPPRQPDGSFALRSQAFNAWME